MLTNDEIYKTIHDIAKVIFCKFELRQVSELTDDELLYAVAAGMEWNRVYAYDMACKEVGVNMPFSDTLERGTLNITLPYKVRQELRKAYEILNK